MSTQNVETGIAPDREEVRRWVINYQHTIVIQRYDDIDEGHEIREFFARYLYPSVEDRSGYEYRNEFFRKLVEFYRRGKIGRLLGPSTIVYAPIIWMADRLKELPDYLQRTVALYDSTNELDIRLVDALAARVRTKDDLNEAAYRAAYCESSTHEERRAQVQEVVSIGEFVVKLVERGGIVDLVLEHCPHIPFFVRNQYIRGINESISMVQTGFRAFKRQKGRIHEFKEICRERELAYVDWAFGVEPSSGSVSGASKNPAGS